MVQQKADRRKFAKECLGSQVAGVETDCVGQKGQNADGGTDANTNNKHMNAVYCSSVGGNS